MVLFISNVIRDDGSNSRLPTAQWNDETLIQHDLRGNAVAQISQCYSSYDAAVDAMRGKMADQKRLFSNGLIRRVSMDNS
jgi:hypothetical protein